MVATPAITIGVSDGHQTGPVFGSIADLALGDENVVFILDKLALGDHVFAVTRDGDPLASIGARGRGPGELIEPSQLMTLRDHRLMVLDRPNARANLYRFEGGKFRVAGEVPLRLPRSPSALCVLGDRLVVLTYFDDNLLHTVDAESGRSLDLAFGAPFLAAAEQLMRVDAGRLVCDAASERIYVGAVDIPVLRAYDADGELLWEHWVQAISGLEITALPNGGKMQRIPDGGAHALVSLVLLPNGRVMAQYGRYDERVEEIEGVVSVVVDQGSGKELRRVDTIPRIVSITPQYVWGVRSLPYPSVLRYPVAILDDLR